MDKKLFHSILIFLTISSATLAWLCEFRAVEVAGASPWVWPIFWFSAFFIFLALDIVLFSEIMLLEIVAIVSFAISLFFAFTFWHLLVLFASSLLILASVRGIKKDFEMNTKISIWKSFHMGKMKMLLALSLLVASQYYAITSSLNGPVIMPKFDVSPISEKLVGPMLALMNPEFESMPTKDITVDDFILQSQKNSIIDGDDAIADELINSRIPANVLPEQREIIKQNAKKQMLATQSQIQTDNVQLVLTEGRMQLSKMIGRQVRGDEKISVVFSGIVDQKINDFFQPKGVNADTSNPAAEIFSIVLFLTVLSLGSIILPLWLAVVIALFWLCKKTNLVEIKKVMVEQEIIA